MSSSVLLSLKACWGGGHSQIPAQAPEGHYMLPFSATPQSNLVSFAVLACSMLPLFFIFWPNDVVVVGCLFDSTAP